LCDACSRNPTRLFQHIQMRSDRGSTSSDTVASLRAKCTTIPRRVGSANAAKLWLRLPITYRLLSILKGVNVSSGEKSANSRTTVCGANSLLKNTTDAHYLQPPGASRRFSSLTRRKKPQAIEETQPSPGPEKTKPMAIATGVFREVSTRRGPEASAFSSGKSAFLSGQPSDPPHRSSKLGSTGRGKTICAMPKCT
jgi:hypothetical protein